MSNRVSDINLIPKNAVVYWLFLLISVLSVLGLELLYLGMPKISEKLGRESIEAFDIGEKGSISVWYVSMLWFLASIVSLQCFMIAYRSKSTQKHSDVWIWSTAVFFYMSLDSATGMRDLFRDTMIFLSGTPIHGDGSIWWIGLYVIVFGMIGTRILGSIRHYLLSCNALLVCGCSHIIAACVEMNILDTTKLHELIIHQNMVKTALEILGNIFLVLSISLFARHLKISLEQDVQNRDDSKSWKNQNQRNNDQRNQSEKKGGGYQGSERQQDRETATGAAGWYENTFGGPPGKNDSSKRQ